MNDNQWKTIAIYSIMIIMMMIGGGLIAFIMLKEDVVNKCNQVRNELKSLRDVFINQCGYDSIVYHIPFDGDIESINLTGR